MSFREHHPPSTKTPDNALRSEPGHRTPLVIERASWDECIPLDDGKSPNGIDLGSLSFIEGDRPGSNLTYVEADSLVHQVSTGHVHSRFRVHSVS